MPLPLARGLTPSIYDVTKEEGSLVSHHKWTVQWSFKKFFFFGF